jgi:hypothetical protein
LLRRTGGLRASAGWADGRRDTATALPPQVRRFAAGKTQKKLGKSRSLRGHPYHQNPTPSLNHRTLGVHLIHGRYSRSKMPA